MQTFGGDPQRCTRYKIVGQIQNFCVNVVFPFIRKGKTTETLTFWKLLKSELPYTAYAHLPSSLPRKYATCTSGYILLFHHKTSLHDSSMPNNRMSGLSTPTPSVLLPLSYIRTPQGHIIQDRSQQGPPRGSAFICFDFLICKGASILNTNLKI